MIDDDDMVLGSFDVPATKATSAALYTEMRVMVTSTLGGKYAIFRDSIERVRRRQQRRSWGRLGRKGEEKKEEEGDRESCLCPHVWLVVRAGFDQMSIFQELFCLSEVRSTVTSFQGCPPPKRSSAGPPVRVRRQDWSACGVSGLEWWDARIWPMTPAGRYACHWDGHGRAPQKSIGIVIHECLGPGTHTTLFGLIRH